MSQWLNPGYTETSLPLGVYDVEFKVIEGWAAPNIQTVEISEGETTIASGIYSQPGALQILLEPEEARNAGAQWRRAGTATWYDSGYTEEDIPAGPYIIEFKAIPEWMKPEHQNIIVQAGQTYSKMFTYSDERPGSLQVWIEPSVAQVEGARWRRVGTIQWHESDDIETDIIPGRYAVEFREVFGWLKPADKLVDILAEKTSSLNGLYARSHGSGLLVQIEPEAARTAGARWRRVGTGAWRKSGDIEHGLPDGTYTVEFKEIMGWVTPVTSGVNVEDSSGYLLKVYRDPDIPAGDLNVMIEPSAVHLSGAHWRRAGTISWRQSGEVEFNLPIQEYIIEFRPVEGWQHPDNKTVLPRGGQLTQVRENYILDSGQVDPDAIPTLDEWAKILLTLTIMIISIYVYRRL